MLSCFAVLFSVDGLFLFMSCELSQLAIVNAVNVIKIVGRIIAVVVLSVSCCFCFSVIEVVFGIDQIQECGR